MVIRRVIVKYEITREEKQNKTKKMTTKVRRRLRRGIVELRIEEVINYNWKHMIAWQNRS